MKIGDVLVHKSLGSQPLVVVSLEGAEVTVRYAVLGQYGVESFESYRFQKKELETPIESMEREGEIFKALNVKREEINATQNTRPGPVGISHLN